MFVFTLTIFFESNSHVCIHRPYSRTRIHVRVFGWLILAFIWIHGEWRHTHAYTGYTTSRVTSCVHARIHGIRVYIWMQDSWVATRSYTHTHTPGYKAGLKRCSSGCVHVSTGGARGVVARSGSMLSGLPAFVSACLHACLHTSLPACLPDCPPAVLSSSLHTYLPACLTHAQRKKCDYYTTEKHPPLTQCGTHFLFLSRTFVNTLLAISLLMWQVFLDYHDNSKTKYYENRNDQLARFTICSWQ